MAVSAGAAVLDTRAMPWEPHVGVDGGKMKVLAQAEDGSPRVILEELVDGD